MLSRGIESAMAGVAAPVISVAAQPTPLHVETADEWTDQQRYDRAKSHSLALQRIEDDEDIGYKKLAMRYFDVEDSSAKVSGRRLQRPAAHQRGYSDFEFENIPSIVKEDPADMGKLPYNSSHFPPR